MRIGAKRAKRYGGAIIVMESVCFLLGLSGILVMADDNDLIRPSKYGFPETRLQTANGQLLFSTLNSGPVNAHRYIRYYLCGVAILHIPQRHFVDGKRIHIKGNLIYYVIVVQRQKTYSSDFIKNFTVCFYYLY